MKNFNGLAKWIIVALAVAGLIFNTGVFYNEARHLKAEIKAVELRREKDMARIDKRLENIEKYLLGEK